MQSLTLNTVAPDATPFCGTHHRWPDDIAGYVVVRTRFGEGKIRDEAVFPAPDAYGDAIALAREIRRKALEADSLDYARIDVVYVDGCRGIL